MPRHRRRAEEARVERNARGNLVELDEVKTSTARTDVYSAVGQLMVHGAASCEEFVVLPNPQ